MDARAGRAGDEVPDGTARRVVSLADKLDTLASFFWRRGETTDRSDPLHCAGRRWAIRLVTEEALRLKPFCSSSRSWNNMRKRRKASAFLSSKR